MMEKEVWQLPSGQWPLPQAEAEAEPIGAAMGLGFKSGLLCSDETIVGACCWVKTTIGQRIMLVRAATAKARAVSKEYSGER